jgi:RecA/RadA recombinase
MKNEPPITAKDVIKKIQQEAKRSKLEGAVLTADELHNPFDLRRPCGVMSLDLETGGGLPAGGLSQVDGPEGVGKNFILFQYMRKCQELYKDKAAIAMACFEMVLDKDFARSAGVKVAYDKYEIDLIQRYRKSRGQKPLTKADITRMKKQLGEFLIIRGSAEYVMDKILEVTASNTFQIVGVDSWDMLLPPDDADKSMGDDPKMAGQAGMQTRFMRKFHSVMNTMASGRENETTVIGIKQVRAKMSTMRYGRPWAATGAYALRHGKLVNLTLAPGKKVMDTIAKVPIGKMVNWEITKGKAGCHEGGKGEYLYLFKPPSIDMTRDLIACCVEYGIIDRKGAYYYLNDKKGYLKDIEVYINKDINMIKALQLSLVHEKGLNIRYV